MKIDKLILEVDEGIPLYKINLAYKGEEVEFFFNRNELLNGLLKSTSSAQTISYLINLVKSRFKENKISFKDFFFNLKSINIINKKTNSSFQINRIADLSNSEKTDYQIVVGFKKELGNNYMVDISDANNTDGTNNSILDVRLQNALNQFKKVVESDKE